MVRETYIMFTGGDVTGIRVRCNAMDCGRETLLPLQHNVLLPQACPHCHQAWIADRGAFEALSNLLAGLRYFKWTGDGMIGVVFEIKVDDNQI